MDFEINEIVLYCDSEARIIGYRKAHRDFVIHRYEDKNGWNLNSEELYDKTGNRVNKGLKELKHCWYVGPHNLYKLNSEIVEEIQLEQEDLTMEKLILKKLVKLEKVWNSK